MEKQSIIIIMELENGDKFQFNYDDYDSIMECCNYDENEIDTLTSNNDLLSRMLEGWSNVRCFETFIETVIQCFTEAVK